MKFKKISPRFFVSEQIAVADVELAAKIGIRMIIGNRPHNESPTQPETSEIADAAERFGITFLHIPIDGLISDGQVADFEAAYRAEEGLILAYCGSGRRSASLWALTEAKSLDADTILSTTAKSGFDLSAMRSRLVARRG